MGHKHHQWLKDAGQDIQKNYEDLFQTAARSGRTQEVGHGHERLWQRFLQNWLPPQYEVDTRKYIIGPKDPEATPFETDIVIFNPGYPAHLRQMNEVMSGGVAAAFSTKLTIRPDGVREAAQHSAALQRIVTPDYGHARLELWKPYIFGLLAASHDWKAPGSTPNKNVAQHLYDSDLEYSRHPAESIDLVCVADLGTWSKMSHLQELPDPSDGAWWNPEVPFIGETISISHSLYRSNVEVTPLAFFLSALYGLMSWRNTDMGSIANDFRRSSNDPTGSGFARFWPAQSVLTDEAISKMRGTPYKDVNRLDSKIQGQFIWQ